MKLYAAPIAFCHLPKIDRSENPDNLMRSDAAIMRISEVATNSIHLLLGHLHTRSSLNRSSGLCYHIHTVTSGSIPG